MTGDLRIAAASRVFVSQRSESGRTCRKLATPVASIVSGATNTLSSESISKPCNRQSKVTVDFPEPLGPINRIPRPARPTQAACRDTNPWQRDARVNTANSMYSYRVWWGNRSICRERTTSAVRSDGDKRTKFDEFVAPPKHPDQKASIMAVAPILCGGVAVPGA